MAFAIPPTRNALELASGTICLATRRQHVCILLCQHRVQVSISWLETDVHHWGSQTKVRTQGLAGIAFSWAQCLKEDARKEKALLASKQFFQSLILLFLTILLKYISFVHVPGIAIPNPVVIIFKILIFYSLGATAVFFFAGLYTTSKYLWREEKKD